MIDGEVSISPIIDSKNIIQNRDWLNTLPHPHIISNTDNVFSYGGMIERNSDKWHGTYRRGEPNEKGYFEGVLILEPYIDENIIPLPDGYFIDQRIARIDKEGKIVPKFEEGWKELLPRVEGKEYSPLVTPKEDIPTEEDGKQLIFRGVDYKAMQRFIINNKMRSGEVELGLPQLDRSYELFFADGPETAFEYAYGTGYTQPTFEQPSYVFSIKMPDTNVVLKPESSEVVLHTEGIKLEDIQHIYEVRPYEIKSSREIPIREFPEKNSMVILTDLTFYYPPEGKSVYREVDINELIPNNPA